MPGPAGLAMIGGTKEIGKLPGDTVKAASQAYIAAVQAKAQREIAKTVADADKFQTSVNEADEILSILDRPCVRARWQISPDLTVDFDLSIMSILGLMAAYDINRQYAALHKAFEESGIWDTEQAENNTQEILGNLGTIPLDDDALAILSGVVEPPPVSDKPKAQKRVTMADIAKQSVIQAAIQAWKKTEGGLL
jgi:hypothetical protein